MIKEIQQLPSLKGMKGFLTCFHDAIPLELGVMVGFFNWILGIKLMK